MKKLFLFCCILVLMLQGSYAQTKTAIGLTDAEIALLEKQNPDVKIQISKFDPNMGQYFQSVTDAQRYVDSVKQKLQETLTVPERQVVLSSGQSGRFAPCGCGDYSAYAGSAGLFSSFNMSFSYCDGAVSNANINTSGLQIGWTLGGTSSSYTGLYSCSTATATFGIGIFSWTQTFRIMWHFNPNSCTFFYNLSNGSCGTSL